VTDVLRVVIADDERPARAFLAAALRACRDVELVGDADGGSAAVRLIEATHPDLALLDLQMPEVDGLSVIRLVRKSALPLVAFVTAYDEYAVRAFEVNAVDYLLKPVDPDRLAHTVERARSRLEREDLRVADAERARKAVLGADGPANEHLRRIPVREHDDILLVPVDEIASIVARGELLYLFTAKGARHIINYRLKDLEARLDPALFVRLSRSALVNLSMVQRITPMPGGSYVVSLNTRQQLPVSRQRARILREHVLRL
jgi:two-component system LytT family response regulator